jgi:hypothetical protein
VIVLAVAFVILVGLLLWLLAAVRGRWLLKLALICAVPAFAFAIVGTANSLRGWPTGDSPPTTATLIWAVVEEPDPQAGSPGAVYLWLATGTKPRAYRLPYSRQLHKQLVEATALTKRGQTVAFTRRGRGGRTGRGGAARGAFRFYRLRPPPPPKKQVAFAQFSPATPTELVPDPEP